MQEEFYGKPVLLADRDMVEQASSDARPCQILSASCHPAVAAAQGCDEMLEQSKTEDVAFLVVGDPFAATTHTDLILRAVEMGIKATP